MLRNIADNIKYCLDRAAEARDRVNETTDPVQKAEYLHAELGWLRLARSYEFANSLEDFLRKPRLPTAAVWHQRILDAYKSLIVKNANDECGNQRTASLVTTFVVRVLDDERLISIENSLMPNGCSW